MQRCYTEPSPSLSALMETERGGGEVGEKKKAASADLARVLLCL